MVVTVWGQEEGMASQSPPARLPARLQEELDGEDLRCPPKGIEHVCK